MKELYLKFQAETREGYALAGVKNYLFDGPISDSYWDAAPRIAVLNLEAYGYEGCGEVPVAEEFKRWIRKGNKTPRNTAVLVNGLRRSMESNQPESAERLKASYYDVEQLLCSINNIAYLNVRKRSNVAVTQNLTEIYRESTGEGLKLLKTQFKILVPEIIIVGGRKGCDAANRIFEFSTSLKYRGSNILRNGSTVVSVRHPSRLSYSMISLEIDRIKEMLRNR